MSVIPLQNLTHPASCRPVKRKVWVQSTCSNSGRSCSSISRRFCRSELHTVAFPGRVMGSKAMKRQRYVLRERTTVSASYKPYSYNQKDYLQVKLILVAEAPDKPMGVLLLSRVDEFGERTDMEHVLTLQVGGDALVAIRIAHENVPVPRPFALDLLWKVLQRGQDISNRDWKLIRVAIVAMEGFTYIGRLFFGNTETGEVAWDCDCRPSDGIWLSKQAQCPLYVHRLVWSDHKSRTREVIQGNDDTADFLLGKSKEPEDLTGTKGFTTIREDDPEPVKRLKREMAVALSEEDYVAAARIRDHPFMKIVKQIIEAKVAGRDSEAKALQEELLTVVNAQQ